MAISDNYCEPNPVQGAKNYHCYHDVKANRARQDGTRMIGVQCCWCGSYTEEERFVEHGPHKPKAVLKVNTRRKKP